MRVITNPCAFFEFIGIILPFFILVVINMYNANSHKWKLSFCLYKYCSRL